MVREEVIGFLRLDGKDVYKFSTQDGDRLKKLAYAAAIALENAKQYSQSFDEITERKRSANETRLLLNLSKAISEASSFSSAIEAALKLVCNHTNWILGELWSPNAAGNSLEYQYNCYTSNDENLHKFIAASKHFEFRSNVGIPGRV